MPRAVRNFWIDLEVSGRRTNTGTGPRPINGLMSAELYLRRAGYGNDSNEISPWSLRISCHLRAHRSPGVDIILKGPNSTYKRLVTVAEQEKAYTPDVFVRHDLEEDNWIQLCGTLPPQQEIYVEPTIVVPVNRYDIEREEQPS